MFALDPHRLDRGLAEFARRQRGFEAALVSSSAEEHAFELVPEDFDHELLRELQASAARDPIAAPAARWLGWLLREQRTIPATRKLADTLYRERYGIHAPEPGRFTLAELRERALAEGARREAWLAALAERAPELARRRFELWEAQAEVEAELELQAFDAEVSQRLSEHARALLRATADAYAELGVRSFGALLDVALGASVPGEWPARPNARALAELVREGGIFGGLKPEGFDAPRVYGASSVLRGLARLGRAIHDAGAAPKLPFVLAREPSGQRQQTFGALFALVPTKAPFAERRLGVGRARARDYQRSLGRVVLLGTREAALRALLGGESRSARGLTRDRFSELFLEALGFEPAPGLTGAVFAGDRDGVALSGLLLAAAKERALTETHDEDWFRNPRAASELRAELETPPPRAADAAAVQAGVHALTRLVLEPL
jgi:hypothetical protein